MSTAAPETQFWDFFRGAIATRAAAIVAELGVADALAAGPRPVSELAAEVDADADALERLLRALASEGVFASTERGVYRNTPSSDLLRSGTPWAAFAELFGGVFLEAIAGLGATGAPALRDDFWARLAENPRERMLFDLAMEEGKERRLERLAGIELHDGDVVVDVGGGNGSLLRELIARRPRLRGIVFDLPETVRDEETLAASGIEFVEGSFFDGVPEGDVYTLGTILHDWTDHEAGAILATIRRHARSGARVLILDSVIPAGDEPHGGKWLDLLMLALFAGRERTEPEWRALIEGAGLCIDAIEDGLVQATCP